MLTLLLSLLLCMLVAFKLVALGSLILAGIGLWVFCRFAFWFLDFCLRSPCKRRGGSDPQHRLREVPPATVHRYREEKRPVPPPQPIRYRPEPSPRARRSSMPAWFLVALGLLILGLVGFGFRSNRYRASGENQTAPPAKAKARPPAKGYDGSTAKAQQRSTPTPEKAKGNSASSTPVAGWGPAAETARADVLKPVVGRGPTIEAAHDDALEEAWDQVIVYLRGQQPPVEWTPSVEYVRKHFQLTWEDLPPEEFNDPVGCLQQVRLQISITPKNREAIAKMDQHYRIEQRLIWVGKIFAGLVALLAAVAGYIRLDEWSKGYYTTWLRLVGIGLVGVAAGGVWAYLHR